jgi:hypothetical protein
MDNAFIRFGHGYETGSRGRCEAFDGFTILAAPLHQEGDAYQAAFGPKARETRVFNQQPNGNGGTCYGAFAIKLASREGSGEAGRDLYILMHHGAGREVLKLPQFYDGGALRKAILAMPEREQYSLLFMIWKTANNARSEAQAETRQRWVSAIVQKRIRQKRRNGMVRVEIVAENNIQVVDAA